MYPFIRLIKVMAQARRMAPLGADGVHVSEHICWPHDIDMWWEMNNGRVFTLYDLGRLPYAQRTGFIATVKKHRWGLTVAGSTIRYRRRLRMFDRFTMKTRTAGWDGRFFYMEQSMWKRDGECASHALLRLAVTGKNGIVPAPEVAAAMGFGPDSPPLPDWVQAWISADATRPWPPMQG